MRSGNLVWKKQTSSYGNGLQIVLSCKSLLIPTGTSDSNESNSRSKISDNETCAENFHGSRVYWKDLWLNCNTGVENFIFDFEIICRSADKLDVTKRNILRVKYKPNYIAIKAHITPTWNELIRNIINKCMI